MSQQSSKDGEEERDFLLSLQEGLREEMWRKWLLVY
jgi:hypothetical protein